MLREYLLALSLIEYTIIHSAPLQEMCGARKVPVLSLSREARAAQKALQSVILSTMWLIPKRQTTAGSLPDMSVIAGLQTQSLLWPSVSILPPPEGCVEKTM